MYPVEDFQKIYVDIPSPRNWSTTPPHYLWATDSDLLPKGAVWRAEEKE